MPNNSIMYVANSGPDDSMKDVIFLARYQGTVGSQDFNDLLGNVAVINGTAKYSNTAPAPLRGTSSLDLVAANSFLSYDNVPGLAFGTGEFCVEGFTLYTQSPGGGVSRGLMQISIAPGGLRQAFDNTLAINFRATDARWEIYAADANIGVANSPNLNTVYHWALERYNNVTKLYIDGVAIITINDTRNYTGNNFALGAIYAPVHCGLGYHNSVRITKAARYKGNFTPPANI